MIDQQLNPDDVIIMWLEDDWKLNDKIISLEHIIENYLSNLTHINLTMLVDKKIIKISDGGFNYKQQLYKLIINTFNNDINSMD